MALFPETIETDRLQLERATTAHAADLYPHVREGAPAIEEITRYVTWNPHRSLKETHDWLAECEASFEKGESPTYLVYPKPGEPLAGEVGGTTGMNVRWDRRTAELGLWLRKPLWGRGYSGERAHALMRVAFETLDLDVVTVSHAVENEPSKHAITKYMNAVGGRTDGTLRNGIAFADGSIHDIVHYSVTAEEWAGSDVSTE